MIKQRGNALLSALFIMTLVAITTTTFTLEIKHQLDKTKLLFQSTQFNLETQFIRFWAMDFLTQKKKHTFGKTPGENTYTQSNIFSPMHQNTHFSCQIIDLNAKFNLNNLNYSSGKTTFYRLAKHALEDTANKKSYPLTSALTHWISEYQPSYGRKHDTNIAHLPFVSLSELALVPLVDIATLTPLMPYLTALPHKTPINLNTAPEDLLMALTGGTQALESMEALIAARGEKGIQSLETIKPILKKLGIEIDDVTTESAYFLSIGKIKKNTQVRTVYTLLERIKNQNGTYDVRVIHETWNTD